MYLKDPCLIHATCDYCETADGTCAAFRTTYMTNGTALQDVRKYGSKIEYECSLGKEFKSLGGGTDSSVIIQCGWNGQWSPVDTLTQCECNE